MGGTIKIKVELLEKEDVIHTIKKFFSETYIEDSDSHCSDLLREIEEISTVGSYIQYDVKEAHGVAYIREDYSKPFEPIAISKE